MRREDLQLRQLAKTGDTEACLKLGEAYLTGSPGIAKNTSIGISYLRLAIPKAEQRVASCFWDRQSEIRNPDRKSTRLNSSHSQISYAVFCLKKKKKTKKQK